MAISVRGTHTATAGAGQDLTLIPATAGYVPNDLILIDIGDDQGGVTHGGLSRLTAVVTGAGNSHVQTGGFLIGGASEGAFTVTTTGVQGWGARITCYNPDGGVWNFGDQAQSDGQSATNPFTSEAINVTEGVGDVALVHCAGTNDSNSALDTPPSGFTIVGTALSPSSFELHTYRKLDQAADAALTTDWDWAVADSRLAYMFTAFTTGGAPISRLGLLGVG